MINGGQMNIFVLSLTPIKHGEQSTYHKTSIRFHKIKNIWSILENLGFKNSLRGVHTLRLGT